MTIYKQKVLHPPIINTIDQCFVHVKSQCCLQKKIKIEIQERSLCHSFPHSAISHPGLPTRICSTRSPRRRHWHRGLSSLGRSHTGAPLWRPQPKAACYGELLNFWGAGSESYWANIVTSNHHKPVQLVMLSSFMAFSPSICKIISKLINRC